MVGSSCRPSLLHRSFWRLRWTPKARERDRIAATRELLDRGWGKAVGYAYIEGADPLNHDGIAAEIRSTAEALKQERG